MSSILFYVLFLRCKMEALVSNQSFVHWTETPSWLWCMLASWPEVLLGLSLDSFYGLVGSVICYEFDIFLCAILHMQDWIIGKLTFYVMLCRQSSSLTHSLPLHGDWLVIKWVEQIVIASPNRYFGFTLIGYTSLFFLICPSNNVFKKWKKIHPCRRKTRHLRQLTVFFFPSQ
jgi:hypothetical protein